MAGYKLTMFSKRWQFWFFVQF